MSSSVKGGGGELTMYLKHYDAIRERSNLAWQHVENTYLKTLLILRLLLVYYTKPEVNLIGLLKVGLHLHDLGESLLSMIQRPIPVV